MKTTVAAVKDETGVIEPRHEIEVVCSNCQDPVSQAEQDSGLCSACGAPWQSKQSVRIWVTTLPPTFGGVM